MRERWLLTPDRSPAVPAGSSKRGVIQGDQCQELMKEGAGQERGDLAMVVLGLNLNQVKADQVEASQPAHQPERIAAGWSPDLGRPRSRREARIDEIDVEAQEDRTLAESLDDFGHHVIDSALQQCFGR